VIKNDNFIVKDVVCVNKNCKMFLHLSFVFHMWFFFNVLIFLGFVGEKNNDLRCMWFRV